MRFIRLLRFSRAPWKWECADTRLISPVWTAARTVQGSRRQGREDSVASSATEALTCTAESSTLRELSGKLSITSLPVRLTGMTPPAGSSGSVSVGDFAEAAGCRGAVSRSHLTTYVGRFVHVVHDFCSNQSHCQFYVGR